MTNSLTPLRDLNDEEKAQLEKLRAIADSHEAGLTSLLSELVVARGVVREVRRVMRCQPPQVKRALDGLPHMPRGTFTEFRRD